MDIRNFFLSDGLSMLTGSLVVLFTGVLFVYSLGYIRKKRIHYYCWYFLTALSSLAVVFAGNIWVILVSWGFLGLALFQLINREQTDAASSVAKKAFIIIGGSDSLMLLGFILYYHLASTSLITHARVPVAGNAAFVAFILVAIGCLAKAGCMPFHTWVPEVAVQAEIPVVAFLPASLDKLLGIYLLVRAVKDMFVINMCAQAVLFIVGSCTILGAVMMALVQHNTKKLLGYHAVSQVGYMVVAIAAATPLGFAAALFHMINNALYKSCLFLSAGNVEKATGRGELGELGGLSRSMPFTFFAALTAALSISGIPPLNGFVSKWMVYQSLIELFRGIPSLPLKIIVVLSLVTALIGSALTLASFLKLIASIFLGKVRHYGAEVGAALFVPGLILSGLCIISGIFFMPLIIPLLTYAAGKSVIVGLWNPPLATSIIIFGIFIGLLVFKVSVKSLRASPPYTGGEPVESEPAADDFYADIKELPTLGSLYQKAEKKHFDMYEDLRILLFALIKHLRRLHNGILSTYIVWVLVGAMGLFVFILR